jgi:hypothetical protein
MFDPDVVVVKADRLVLRESQDAFGPVVETIERSHFGAEPTARSVDYFS